MAIAYGLQRLGQQVTVFDESDRAYRASRGNFGLVWVQGKGVALPSYARWTRLSASLWPEFAAELYDATGLSLELQQRGGIDICLTEEEAQQNLSRLESLRSALDGDYPFEFLGHNALRELVPEIGAKVTGATYCPEDGHVNPLYLLQALYKAFRRQGGEVQNDGQITAIRPVDQGFMLDHRLHDQVRAGKVVLCAGLGNARLAPMVGLQAPVEPVRGQVLICERIKPFLNYPSVQIRQVGEGAVQIGDSKENVGFNDDTTPSVLAQIAYRAVQVYPLLQHVRMVRAWGALRVMSPDGHPIYDQSLCYPGAWVVTCHSGVTLAAVHAQVLAGWIVGQQRPPYVENFSAKRFAVHQAA